MYAKLTLIQHFTCKQSLGEISLNLSTQNVDSLCGFCKKAWITQIWKPTCIEFCVVNLQRKWCVVFIRLSLPWIWKKQGLPKDCCTDEYGIKFLSILVPKVDPSTDPNSRHSTLLQIQTSVMRFLRLHASKVELWFFHVPLSRMQRCGFPNQRRQLWSCIVVVITPIWRILQQAFNGSRHAKKKKKTQANKAITLWIETIQGKGMERTHNWFNLSF